MIYGKNKYCVQEFKIDKTCSIANNLTRNSKFLFVISDSERKMLSLRLRGMQTYYTGFPYMDLINYLLEISTKLITQLEK